MYLIDSDSLIEPFLRQISDDLLSSPQNEKFLHEICKSSNNLLEKTLYLEEIKKLQKKSKNFSPKNKLLVNQLYKEAQSSKKLPMELINKLWISRTCTNTGEAQEIAIKNMINAYEFISKKRNQKPKIDDLIDIHKITLENIPGESHIAGRLRTPETDYLIKQIFHITKDTKKPVNPYSAPKDVIKDMKKLDEYIDRNYDTKDVFALAADIFTEIIRIHPFINGNGRATRLFTEQFLLSKGYQLTKWPEETLYRKIYSNEQIAEALKQNSKKL